MKQNYSVKAFLLGLMLSVTGLAMNAASYITRDGIRYVYNDTKTSVQVTQLKAPAIYTGEITVPESIINSSNETIPVVGVGGSAFSGSSVTKVVLASSVKTIADYAFDGCEELVTVEMPGVTEIGHWSFRNCYILENLVFPEGLKSIGNFAFDKNRKMTEVDLPASVTNLGGFIFEGCTNIKRFICRAVTPPAIKKGYLDGEEIYTLFEDTDYGDIDLYVPEGCIPSYKSQLGWNYFKNRIYSLETLGVSSIAEDTDEVSVKAIGNGAVEITLPAATDVTVYSIVGNVVKSAFLPEGKSVITDLLPGFYVIYGKKVVVK